MADIELVIKISEEDYKGLQEKDKFNNMFLNYYEKLIVHGTPLPKGHGALIDISNIDVIELEDSIHFIRHEKGDDVDVYIGAPIIIEANKSEIPTGSTTDAPENNVGSIEPTTKDDLALIHTWGLDEEIRCAMCTNSMKSNRGCDGSCVVNKDMYNAVMDAIEKRIQPTTKNDLGVDCISRKQAIRELKESAEHHANDSREEALLRRDRDIIKALPPVTPIRPKGHWIMTHDYLTTAYGSVDYVKCSCCGEYSLEEGNYCPNCGAKMEEVEE